MRYAVNAVVLGAVVGMWSACALIGPSEGERLLNKGLKQAEKGQTAADEHSPVTIPVVCRPRSRMTATSELAVYGLPPGESK